MGQWASTKKSKIKQSREEKKKQQYSLETDNHNDNNVSKRNLAANAKTENPFNAKLDKTKWPNHANLNVKF